MATSQQPHQPTTDPDQAAARSENLLPADDGDDGRFDVAEEVNLDQQSDRARHIGQAPDLTSEQDGVAATPAPR